MESPEILIEKDEVNSVSYFESTGTLMLWGEIDQNASREICQIAIQYGSDIKRIIINSRGGEVTEALAIGDIISSLGIDTVGIGQLYSMGCYLFSLGIRRMALPNSSFLIHAGAATIGHISFNSARSFQDFWEKQIEEQVLSVIIRNTKLKKKDKFNKDILAGMDYYFTAREALDIGLVTNIVLFQEIFKTKHDR